MSRPWWHSLVGVSGPVVDLGAGSGVHAAALMQAGITAVAVDRDRSLAAAARARGVLAVVADGEALPFRAGSVGGGVCMEVLEHVAHPECLLVELRSALRPGAPLIVAVPTSYTERFLWRVHPRYASNSTHVRIFSRSALIETLAAARWRVEEIETRNLAAAIAWIFHGLLRTPADHTGAVHRLAWLERVVSVALKVLRRLPGGNGVLASIERRFGKSWYVHAR